VLWRSAGAFSAFTDRCPHRGARLSLGRIRGDRLECPYHGWQFDRQGQCRLIPALPGFTPPAAHRASAWRVREAHGLVWVGVADAGDDEPFAPPRLDHLPPRRVLCGPFDVATSAPRVVENFLDTAHFGIVHEGSLGARDRLEVPVYQVVADAHGRPGVPLYRAWQPRASSTAASGAWVDYRYQVLSPFSALLEKRADGALPAEAYVLWTAPAGPVNCRVWFTICVDHGAADDATLLDFQRAVFAQDRPILESQRPRELPLSGGELFCAADRLSAAYRRWLEQLGFSYGCC
jgi:phenylpropionate dioxygenase-like ring-hydroxylating dioxygenase large terminal subunit